MSARNPNASRLRERRLNKIAYRALAIGFNKAHLGPRWMQHFGSRADRFFDLATQEWRDGQTN